MIRIGIRTYFRNLFSKPNKNAIWVFGFPKSGTSAITGLLSAATGLSATIDTKYLDDPFRTQIIERKLSIKHLVNKYSYPFSKQILKEPNATFFINEIGEFFLLHRYIFIVRNPFQNIRSILNRLNLPGNREYISMENVHPNWRYLFQVGKGKDYIDELVNWYLKANSQYDKIEVENCKLVRYEDFLLSKEKYIMKLSEKLGLSPKFDISNLVNYQFQPKGNSNVDPEKFFGETNYNIIKNKCVDIINYYGYR